MKKKICLILISALGVSGMIMGGQICGLLGTALVMLVVFCLCEDTRLKELDREIDRVYYRAIPKTQSVTRMPVIFESRPEVVKITEVKIRNSIHHLAA
jgi:hypothetical protein